MCKINSLFKLIITSLLRNNCVPVRNKSLLFLILNLPLRVRAIPFIITGSSLYLRPVAKESKICFYLPKVTLETLRLLRKVAMFMNKL